MAVREFVTKTVNVLSMVFVAAIAIAAISVHSSVSEFGIKDHRGDSCAINALLQSLLRAPNILQSLANDEQNILAKIDSSPFADDPSRKQLLMQLSRVARAFADNDAQSIDSLVLEFSTGIREHALKYH